VEGALGRRCEALGRRPESAAWAARKRKSMDWAFSELRAMMEVGGSLVVVSAGGVWEDGEVCAGCERVVSSVTVIRRSRESVV